MLERLIPFAYALQIPNTISKQQKQPPLISPPRSKILYKTLQVVGARGNRGIFEGLFEMLFSLPNNNSKLLGQISDYILITIRVVLLVPLIAQVAQIEQ